MIDYTNIDDKQQKQMSQMFSEWLDWFMNDKMKIDPATKVYTDENGKEYVISDYVRIVKSVFGFHNITKQYLSAACSGGKDAVIKYIEGVMPLVSGFNSSPVA